MKRIKELIVSRRGTTLVELMAAMALLSLLLLLISGALRPAAAVTRMIGRMSDAQSLADGVLEAIRMDVENACGYVKLYEDGTDIPEQEGTLSEGRALEYLNSSGEPILVSAEGCGRALLGETEEGEITPGRLFFLTRLRADSDLTHPAEDGELVLGAERREPYGEAYYSGMYLELRFAPTEEVVEEDRAEALDVTVRLYRDMERTDLVLKESRTVELRNGPRWITAVTATK